MKMINNAEKIKKLKEENYQKIFGIKKNTFDKMLKLLNEAYRIEHLKGGHPPKLSVLDRLVIMLSYYRDYRTMENIAFEYGVAKSTICECVKWVWLYLEFDKTNVLKQGVLTPCENKKNLFYLTDSVSF